MNEAKLQKLESIINLVESDKITHKEFEVIFNDFVKVIKELKTQLEGEIAKGDNAISDKCKAMMSDMNRMESDMKKVMDQSSKMQSTEMAKVMSEMKKIMDEIEQVRQSIPTMPSLMPLEAKIEQIKASIPVIKEIKAGEIRDKLESLDGDERLDKSAIKGLQEEIALLKKEISDRPTGGGIFGGRQIRMAEFSFSGDDVTTAFTLPKNPGAKGLAIWAFYQGQYLQRGQQFTIANKTFTTVGWIAATGTKIEGFILL